MSPGLLVVDPSSPTSVFAQLKAFLLNEIAEGVIGPDERLPTEQELCDRFNISRTPVHRALAELAEDGVVTRHRRRGTFVNRAWVEANVGVKRLRVVMPVGSWRELLAEATPPNLTVDAVEVELPELHDHLRQAVADGTAPDLAILDSVWVAEFAEAGLLWSLDKLGSAWTRREHHTEFASTFVKAHTVGGSVVAVQAEADVAGLWYDRNALAKAGLQVPQTWNELRNACRILSEGRREPALALSAGPAAGEATTYTLLAILASCGATVVNTDGVTLASPNAEQALAYIRNLATDGAVSLRSVEYPREHPIEQLATGNAAFALGGSYALPALSEAYGANVERTWARFGFARMPRGRSDAHASLAGGMACAVLRQSRHPDLAMRLLQALVSSESQTRMAETTGQIPTRNVDLSKQGTTGSLLEISSALLDGAIVRPPVASYDRISRQLQQMFSDVLLGRATPEEACRHTAVLVAAITGLPLATG